MTVLDPSSPDPSSSDPSSPDPSSSDPVQLTLWGPSAAGKTALLAQLHLHLENRQLEDRHLEARHPEHHSASAGVPADAWDTYPVDAETVGFFDQMRQRLVVEGHFPTATPLAHDETLRYAFRERESGWRAQLTLEDRAGALFERHDASVRERLRDAHGLVLLFDPLRDPMRLRGEILRALEAIHAERDAGGEPDPRPIAVCLSKADLLIETAADYRQASEDPDAFVRRHLDPSLVHSLRRYCANFRLFPVAAIGLDLGWGVVRPRLLVDEQGRARPVPGGFSLHLLAPFVWAFEALRRAEAIP